MIELWGSSSAEPGSPFAAALADTLGVDVRATGRRGLTLGAALERVPSTPASVVLVVLGGNDPQPSPRHVRAIQDALRARGAARVLWLPPPAYPASSPSAGRREAMLGALVAAGVPHIGTRPRIVHWAADRVHPTARGYREWADSIAAEVRSALADPPAPAARLAAILLLFGAGWALTR